MFSDTYSTETTLLYVSSRKTTDPSVNEKPISQGKEYTTMKVVSTSPKINIKKKPKSLNEPLLVDISHSNSVIQNKDLNVSITGDQWDHRMETYFFYTHKGVQNLSISIRFRLNIYLHSFLKLQPKLFL